MDFEGQGKLTATGRSGAAARIDARFLITARCAFYMLLGLVMSCSRVLQSGAPFDNTKNGAGRNGNGATVMNGEAAAPAPGNGRFRHLVAETPSGAWRKLLLA